MNPPTSQPDLRNAYTDAPDLHPNLILGSLHLLFWLFFHPSAWRNYVARIDPELQGNFCLAELSRAQWQNLSLRKILIQEYVLLSVLVGLFDGLVVWLTGNSAESVSFGIATGMTFSILFSITIGVAVSVAGGISGGAVGGLAYGLLGGFAFGVPISVMALGITDGLAYGSTCGAIFTMSINKTNFSFFRQVGAIIIGILLGSIIIGITYGVTLGMTLEIVFGIARGIIYGIAYSIIVILASGLRLRRIYQNTIIGVILGIVASLSYGAIFESANGAVISIAFGIARGMAAGALLVLPYVMAERVAGLGAGSVAGALPIGSLLILTITNPDPTTPIWFILPFAVISALLGLTQTLWRPILLYPLLAAYNFALLRLDERRAPGRPPLLRRHSAFWDEHQRLPLLGLDEHVVLIAERSPAEGRAAIEYLAGSRQRWAAQSAQIELDARRLERCADVEAIGGAQRELAAGELEGPASALLRSFSRISQDTEAALRQESAYNQRLTLSAVEDRLDGLLRELTRSSERYAARFRPVANHWREIIAARVSELARAVEQRQEIDSPYVIGVPLTERQEIFVGRADVSARIEQLLLDRRRPPLLLYGQRRMGKTSLLNNLGRLLPSTIVPLFVDLQGPASQASDHAGLLYNIARGMADSAQRQRDLALPTLAREALASDPFTRFDEWLDEVERALGQSAALLALDEFEALDGAIVRGRFDEQDVLGMLRHLIQHRPRFKVLLAGSHTLDELERWASYLINVQVVRIGYLSRDEARQLVEHPVEGFALRYEPDAGRRVLDLTRGHPFLVQLLCAEIVALKNEQPIAARRLARLDDVATAIPEALRSGSFFFADIQRNQVDPDGLALLRVIAARGESTLVGRDALADLCSGDLDRALDLLARRELIEAVDGGYRFQVELIRRWFAER